MIVMEHLTEDEQNQAGVLILSMVELLEGTANLGPRVLQVAVGAVAGWAVHTSAKATDSPVEVIAECMLRDVAQAIETIDRSGGVDE